ncbi:hypothetical protein Lbir_1101 [Legionella birminghamensis]|uniref:Integral membrane protein n=1 Tax=Legionella birminghamensis TaxID=28083 RepID=A0A378IJP4_9GAMM|nr:hypothetical protein [Legionella birminghamensis]KTC73049.1 hypothetical protein Lbir_1101 [Legionella birminghamensis]STX32374.1 Uncharacterised protein [Legionella birminghamensis]
MLRQSLIYLVLTILVVVFARFAHTLILYIDLFYTYINIKLTPLFTHTGVGVLIRKIILLTFIPVIIALVPALIYRPIKGKPMPYFLELTWCLWLVIVLSNILIR